jgi:hypothetical protein
MGRSLPMTVSPAGRALMGNNEPAKKKGTLATAGRAFALKDPRPILLSRGITLTPRATKNRRDVLLLAQPR